MIPNNWAPFIDGLFYTFMFTVIGVVISLVVGLTIKKYWSE